MPNKLTNKIFIIGLPRTATTSLCAEFLNLGFSVAHTCYTQNTLEQAQVLADTPIYIDYPLLDNYYPNAKFIYLQRNLADWLPSIKQLLTRMQTNVMRTDGGFNPYLKRCFSDVFSPFNVDNIQDDSFLTSCYQQHQQAVFDYFKDRSQDLLTLNLSDADAYQKLLEFLALNNRSEGRFPQLNTGKKVTAWNQIKHPLKIASTNNGRIDKNLPYFMR